LQVKYPFGKIRFTFPVDVALLTRKRYCCTALFIRDLPNRQFDKIIELGIKVMKLINGMKLSQSRGKKTVVDYSKRFIAAHIRLVAKKTMRAQKLRKKEIFADPNSQKIFNRC
jgi:hypothetical protein